MLKRYSLIFLTTFSIALTAYAEEGEAAKKAEHEAKIQKYMKDGCYSKAASIYATELNDKKTAVEVSMDCVAKVLDGQTLKRSSEFGHCVNYLVKYYNEPGVDRAFIDKMFKGLVESESISVSSLGYKLMADLAASAEKWGEACKFYEDSITVQTDNNIRPTGAAMKTLCEAYTKAGKQKEGVKFFTQPVFKESRTKDQSYAIYVGQFLEEANMQKEALALYTDYSEANKRDYSAALVVKKKKALMKKMGIEPEYKAKIVPKGYKVPGHDTIRDFVVDGRFVWCLCGYSTNTKLFRIDLSSGECKLAGRYRHKNSTRYRTKIIVTDKSVYIATGDGLLEFIKGEKDPSKQWKHYTIKDGLPCNHVCNLALNKDSLLLFIKWHDTGAIASWDGFGAFKIIEDINAPLYVALELVATEQNIWISGGYRAMREKENKLHIYSKTNKKWSTFPDFKLPPLCRSGDRHIIFQKSNNSVQIWDEVKNSFEEIKWSPEKPVSFTNTKTPSQRAAVSSNILWLSGGLADRTASSGLYAVDLEARNAIDFGAQYAITNRIIDSKVIATEEYLLVKQYTTLLKFDMPTMIKCVKED